MRIIITGSSGYIGKALIKELDKRQHQVIQINRELLYGSIDKLQNVIKNSNVVINLAGSPILKRWTKRNKTIIYNSRVITTQNLVKAIKELPSNEQPKKFISASAVGIYKSGECHDEQSTYFDNGFLGEVVKGWEQASIDLPENVKRIIFRIGLIIGKDAKPIKNLLLPINLGLGASVGKGNQAFPFIHIDDVVKVFIEAIENKNFMGIYNLVSPQSISNKEFTKTFAKFLNRPVFFFIPEFILKLILGEASILLSKSPVVVPKRLIDVGFKFNYPTIKKALDEIILNN
jgi:uncharacterized protein